MAVALKCAAILQSGAAADDRTRIELALKTAEVFTVWLREGAGA